MNGRDMELRDDQGASLRSRPRPLFYIWPFLAARKINSVWEPVEFIHDVTTDYLLVKKMEELFNRYQLYPIHLRDAIEDMLP